MTTTSPVTSSPPWWSRRTVSADDLAQESGPSGIAVDARYEWLRSWIGIAVVVLAVVIVFLIAIGNSLVRIDHSLKSVNTSLLTVGTSVNPLPQDIEGINGKLSGINTALKAIPSQGVEIEGSLRSANSDLGGTSSDLVSTEGHLGGSVLPDLNAIEVSLHEVDLTAPSVGQRLSGIETTLASARGDTSNIAKLLNSINRSLTSVNKKKLGAVPGVFTTN